MMSPIAIIGVGCLFPGAATPEQFWHNLMTGQDSRTALTQEMLGVDPKRLYDPRKGIADRFYSLRGGYIRGFSFDPHGYSLPPDQLLGLDPMFQWSLYVARQALAGSGYLNAPALGRTGLILGNLSFPTRSSHQITRQLYWQVLEKALQELLDAEAFQLQASHDLPAPANMHLSGYAAAVVAQGLGLGGGYFCLDAACASSLYAVKLACDYLHTGQADMMLAGAVSASDPCNISMGFSIFRALPGVDEDSRPLNRHSSGLIPSEGAGMFVLKRYADAVRDGDPIHAVICGVGLSNDGSGKHVLMPNEQRQILAFERAYAHAGLHPRDIDYLECHATGTPLGDMTELQAIDQFFAAQGAWPRLGAVKSNIGHLLTAAGMAGMLKIIMSMQHGQIPPTIHLTEPVTTGRLTAEQIVQQPMAWNTSVRRAAVNAFGFGGANAHLILEAPPVPEPAHHPPLEVEARTGKMPPMAIIGMDVFLAGCDGLNAFEQTLYTGRSHLRSVPPERWHGLENAPEGAYLDAFEMDFLHYKVPPTPDDTPIPQQLLMLQVADRAIRDAGLQASRPIAVIVAMGTELALHQFRGRVDLDWQIERSLAGMGVALTAEELATLSHLAKESLTNAPQVNQYTSFIGNIMASRIAALWDFHGPAFTVSAEENSATRALEIAQLLLTSGDVEAVVVGAVDLAGGMENVLLRPSSPNMPVGEGAAAVVLKRVDQLTSEQVYGVIEAVVLAQSADEVLQATDLAPESIGYLEICTSDEVSWHKLPSLYPSDVAVGSVLTNIGYPLAASALASLVKVALCLIHRYIPALAGQASRPWFVEQGQLRRAVIHTQSMDGLHGQIILHERTNQTRYDLNHLQHETVRLLPLIATSLNELAEVLAAYRTRLAAGEALDQLVNTSLQQFTNQADAPYCLALVAQDTSEMLREMALAKEGISSGQQWQTPRGSFFTPTPQRGDVAFVYPGAFNAYVGLGRDLFHAFPHLHDEAAQRSTIPARLIGEQYLYPRGEIDTKAHTARFEADTVAMIESGISFATLFTALLEKTFKVRPAAVFGYSMGESSMLFANGVWQAIDLASQWMHASPLFKTRLQGRNEAAAAYLNIPPEGHFWTTQYILAPAEQVQLALAGETQVFLTHINDPANVVISGYTPAVERVISRLKCRTLASPQQFALHSPAIASEYDALFKLHDLPYQPRHDLRFYSTSTYAQVDLTRTHPADMIARMITSPVDFPRMVNTLYADGVRIFIELGPRETCTRWIGKTLKGQPHLAAAISQPRLGDVASVVALLAKLASHRVPIDLSRLMRPIAVKPERQLMKTVRLGGKPMAETILAARERIGLPLVQKIKEAMRKPVSPISEPITYLTCLQQYQTRLQQSAAVLQQQWQQARVPKKDAIWDEADLLEFAQGSIAKVFGENYAEIDQYRRRVRLPMPPYLLVSRVTYNDGKRGEYKPCRLVTEYDIPRNAWYTVDGQAPWAVSVESGQCDLLLISYLGIDFENKGEYVYRLLDCKMTFLDHLPMEGDTLRYDIRINSFARSGRNLLFFFEYDCYIGERRVLEMRDGCAGFFSDQDLAQGRGVIMTDQEKAARTQIVRQQFTPPLRTTKTALSHADLLHLTSGEIATVFGAAYDQGQHNPSLRLPPPAILMLDRITDIDPDGGAWGLGQVEAEKDLHPQDWYFPCHFKDDEVLAGSLMAEGCGQLLQAYMLHLGLQTRTIDARFQPLLNISQVVRCRGQVQPQIGKLRYRMEVTAIGLAPHPYIKANVDIILDGKVIVRFADLGLQLVEKNPRPAALFDEVALEAFATGLVSDCFGAEYKIYDERPVPHTPNGDLKLISRIMQIDGERHNLKQGSLISEYDVPLQPWWATGTHPLLPYSILMEIALQPCGFLSAYLGTTLAVPETDFKFRNLDGEGQLLRDLDVRGKTITNQVTLQRTSSIQGMIIQSFTFELTCEGEPFYRGSAVFGYFTPQALAHQVGLDGGQFIPPQREQAALLALTRHDQLQLLDRVQIGERWVYAEKDIDPDEWFFACHFYQDPVMPGSLGVEAIYEAMQLYAAHHYPDQALSALTYHYPEQHCVQWKYRGQITPDNQRMLLEVMITAIEQTGTQMVIKADASLWKENMRIYEVKQLALVLQAVAGGQS